MASGSYIFLRLHSAHACGVVIRLAVPLPLVLVLSPDSEDCFRGVTPWTINGQDDVTLSSTVSIDLQVWNIPPCVGTGMLGAMFASRRRGLTKSKRWDDDYV
jgi:hypothetical protein